MTKDELMQKLEALKSIPGNTQVVMRHPGIQGAVTAINSMTIKVAGRSVGEGVLHLHEFYPAGYEVDSQPVIVLDLWGCETERLYEYTT